MYRPPGSAPETRAIGALSGAGSWCNVQLLGGVAAGAVHPGVPGIVDSGGFTDAVVGAATFGWGSATDPAATEAPATASAVTAAAPV
jgi:hypothetical protein